MSSGDMEPLPMEPLPKHMTYSKSKVPLLGAAIDYIETSLEFLTNKTLTKAEKLNAKHSRSTLSAPFLAFVCFLLGFTCNMKFEVVTFDDAPLLNDLHFMLMSNEDKIYIEDIDMSRVLWCIEGSDLLVLIISCLLIINSSCVRSPISEYLFLPWLGLALRGLFLRQAPTVGALIYTMAVVNGSINLMFLTSISFLFLMEARFWLEIARVVRSRWERRDSYNLRRYDHYEVETLWSNDDVQSVEVQNFVY